MTIRLVTFDLDDTLWDSSDSIRTSEQSMRHWLAFVEPRILQLDRIGLAEVRAALRKEHPGLEHDVTEMRMQFVAACLKRAGAEPQVATDIAAVAVRKLRDGRNLVRLYPGARATVLSLRERFMVGSLTNGNAEVGKTPLSNCFHFSIAASDVGAAKPEPEMFRAALERAGVAPSEAVHVGNHPENDIAAANAVGIRSVLVDHERTSEPGEASGVVHYLPHLLRLIDELASA